MRARVHVSEDAALTAMFPAAKPGRATVTLRDGRGATRQVNSARGDFQNPYAEGEVRAKFRALAGRALSDRGVSRLEAAIDGVEGTAGLAAILMSLREGV
jgi:2-methylcitrate dehydratase PrpD